MNGEKTVTHRFLLLSTVLILAGCQTIGTTKPTPVALTPVVTNTAAISGGGLVGGAIGSLLNASDRQAALNAEYKALEYSKAGEIVDWTASDGSAQGRVKAVQPYRVGSQDCRQYSHELTIKGVKNAMRGTACRNNDGSWSLLE
jgi:surface antigen